MIHDPHGYLRVGAHVIVSGPFRGSYFRRVTGIRGDVLHFSQVIKVKGETFYWVDKSDPGISLWVTS